MYLRLQVRESLDSLGVDQLAPAFGDGLRVTTERKRAASITGVQQVAPDELAATTNDRRNAGNRHATVFDQHHHEHKRHEVVALGLLAEDLADTLLVIDESVEVLAMLPPRGSELRALLR